MLTSRHGNMLAGAATIGFAALIYHFTVDMTDRVAAYPRLVAGILAVSGALLLLTAIRAKEPGDILFAKVSWFRLGSTVAIWLTAILAMGIVGFYTSIAVMLATLAWTLQDMPSSPRSLAALALFGAATTGFLWLVFRVVLGVATPTGFFL